MKSVSNETILKQLNWRYAVKKFDPARKISQEDWKTLEHSLVLAPSSFGLQPWKFIVVNDPAVREKLVAASWNQRQVVDASHMLIFAIRKNLSVPDVERYMDRIAEVRGVEKTSLEGFKNVVTGFVTTNRPGFDVNTWSSLQTYIALGGFMMAAAMLGIDTCPMEGIDPKKYDEILGLEKLGLGTICACPAGYRAADDKHAHLPKVRFKHEDVITHVG
ncbi:MAG TPA: NAD(P)H-dependent oxidoreductase [Tepidisphaeraceae bacterium]|jgi:nitroreductase|nr:NAD(P)H-dependent oxidoreductase [Tepidisphaeraceae bacterium]